MKERYRIPVGYSGHETGLPSTVAAVALGACCIERHITLDRAMWGSDQAASLEPNGITKIVQLRAYRRAVAGRRRQARGGARTADHQEAAPRGNGRLKCAR